MTNVELRNSVNLRIISIQKAERADFAIVAFPAVVDIFIIVE